MSESFVSNLDPKAPTFTELKTGKYPWWDNLKNNEDVSIQIRKDNTIDVYYRGGAILDGLMYMKKNEVFTASIHSKYIPLKDDDKQKRLQLSSKGVEFTEKIDTMEFAQLDDTTIKAVTTRIKNIFDHESEKTIQFDFAKDPCIIDAEFRFEDGSRVDLVRLDVNSKKIVLIEIKTIGDDRLFSDPAEDKKNIYHQLKTYHDNANAYKEELLGYYTKILEIKKDLGLAKDPICKLKDLNGWQIEPRPLLAFGDCTDNWIKNNAADIDIKIKDIAYGAYYFGNSKPKPSLDLIAKDYKNRHVFI